jgi:hypothetical protein
MRTKSRLPSCSVSIGSVGQGVVTRLEIVRWPIERQLVQSDDLSPGHLDGEAAANVVNFEALVQPALRESKSLGGR